MVHPLVSALVSLVALAGFTQSAAAQGFLKKALKVVTAPVRVPVQQAAEAAKVVTGKQSVDEAVKNSVQHQAQPVKDAGAVTEDVANAAGKVNQAIHSAATEAAGAVAGPAGERVVDTLTAPQRVQHEVETTGVAAVGRVAQTGDLAQLSPLTITLAAAIRTAREQHIKNAKPIPADVQTILGDVFSKAVLDRARYVVGDVRLSLPASINLVHTLDGSGHAVVVDDVIVFSQDPATNMFWWGHEMTHVAQYAKFGVDEFAHRYITDHKKLEAEADQLGGRAVAAQMQRLGVPPLTPGRLPRTFGR